MKIKTCLTIIFILIIINLSSVSANNKISVCLNGDMLNLDTNPIIINNRTLVPFRSILEALGAKVDYEDGYAIGRTKGKQIIIPIEENIIYINSCLLKTDVPAQIVNGRTLIPLRVVSECFGASVLWEDSTQTVFLQTEPENFVEWNETYFYWGDGSFSNSGFCANGYGALYDKKDNKCFCIGYFENNFIIEGKIIYSDGRYYEGEFSNTRFGIRNGTGTLYFGSDSYASSTGWNEDAVDGSFYIYDSGLEITGNANKGKFHGEIKYHSLIDNTLTTQTYNNGKLISSPNNKDPYASPLYSDVEYPLFLYSNDGKTFLGRLSVNKYERESFLNPYSDYGSKYSATSIFNEYGKYGSKYSDESAFNDYASNPPIILDNNGKFIAYLTSNNYKSDGISFSELIILLNRLNQ